MATAAAYLAGHGPATGQERWEESSGWSPATIAAEIAALRAAGRTQLAAAWDARLEAWTYTSKGWYVRIAPNGHPDAFEDITLANGGGLWPQQSITDPSFLELVRLGVRRAKDPRILSTLRATDASVRHDLVALQLFGRYPNDGYGERLVGGSPPGVGHAWPLLTGERGVYTVFLGGDAAPYVDALTKMAGSEELLSEQVWESTAMPTGSRATARVGACGIHHPRARRADRCGRGSPVTGGGPAAAPAKPHPHSLDGFQAMPSHGDFGLCCP